MHGSIRGRREQRCSLLEKAERLRLERNQVCGEFEKMLNSCPGQGIVDTGCSKMMMGSDTFQQYLSLLSSKERAFIERMRERIASGLETTRLGCRSGLQSFRRTLEDKCVVRRWPPLQAMLRF